MKQFTRIPFDESMFHLEGLLGPPHLAILGKPVLLWRFVPRLGLLCSLPSGMDWCGLRRYKDLRGIQDFATQLFRLRPIKPEKYKAILRSNRCLSMLWGGGNSRCLAKKLRNNYRHTDGASCIFSAHQGTWTAHCIPTRVRSRGVFQCDRQSCRQPRHL